MVVLNLLIIVPHKYGPPLVLHAAMNSFQLNYKDIPVTCSSGNSLKALWTSGVGTWETSRQELLPAFMSGRECICLMGSDSYLGTLSGPSMSASGNRLSVIGRAVIHGDLAAPGGALPCNRQLPLAENPSCYATK